MIRSFIFASIPLSIFANDLLNVFFNKIITDIIISPPHLKKDVSKD